MLSQIPKVMMVYSDAKCCGTERQADEHFLIIVAMI
jgi:hypothetical protein